MTEVYLVHHVHILDEEEGLEDVKLIGVYSTKENAEKAVEKLKNVIGFKENPEGFEVNRHVLDKTSWVEGFVTQFT